jgi:hypothetical protein
LVNNHDLAALKFAQGQHQLGAEAQEVILVREDWTLCLPPLDQVQQ